MLALPPELARSALEAAPDAIIIASPTGLIRYANRQVTVLFGYEREEIIGQSVERLIPARFHARHVEHRAAYMAGSRVRPMGAGLALFGQRRDGLEFPVEISLSPIEHEGERLVAAAIRDATVRMRDQARLIATQEEAERARRAADAAREIALRTSQNKGRFLATASHDLRQPLQTLALLNGTLQRLALTPSIAVTVAQQAQAIAAMSRLVNALLDISRLESGAIRPEPCDFRLADLFAELQRDFMDVAGTKGLRLEVEPCGDCVHSDPSLVGQILRNLLSNAIKYTRRGWVRLRCLHQAARVRIEVLDTGVGIPADQLPLIYEEFHQVIDGVHGRGEGYGLGLSIVQRLVSLLKLQLDVSSEVGRGSTFALVLPAGATRGAAASPSTTAPQRVAPARRAHVLLVEDEPAVRDAMRLLLTVEGYRVSAVAGLSEALELLALHGGFDLLVTDYHLSHETGTQVICALRKASGRRLKAVLISGDTSPAFRDLQADPDVFVTSKPVNADELLAVMRALLAMSRPDQV